MVRVTIALHSNEKDALHRLSEHERRDSRAQDVLLIRQGEISIIVTAYQEFDWLGSTRVRIVSRKQITGAIGLDEMTSLCGQLAQWKSNLFKLEEQATRHGMDVPLRIQNEIDFTKEKIADIEAKLAELEVKR